jgi:hypothetical protein
VILWDTGTCITQGRDPAEEQWKHGELKFSLHGTKLSGSFVLVRLPGNEDMRKLADAVNDADRTCERKSSLPTTLPDLSRAT